MRDYTVKSKLISLLNSKYVLFLVFLPIMNIIYIAFRFVFVRVKLMMPLWYFFAIAIPAVILYNILPGLWGWVVTHFVISSIAAFYAHKSRGCYEGKLGLNHGAMWIVIIVIFLAILTNVIY